MIMASSTTSIVLVIDLGSDKPTILRLFDQHQKIGLISGGRVVRGSSRSQTKYENHIADDGDDISSPPSVVQMAVSPDGQWLVSSDDRGRTFVYNLDSLQVYPIFTIPAILSITRQSQYHTTIPSLPHPPNVMTFVPDKPQILLSVLPNNTLHFYDVENNEVPSWAYGLNSRVPKQFFSTPDPVLGVAFEPVMPVLPLANGDIHIAGISQKPFHDVAAVHSAAVFWGSSWLCKLRLDWLSQYPDRRKRRKSEAKQPISSVSNVQNSAWDTRNLRLVTHYRAILVADFLKPGELVLVERPLVDVLSKLPPAFFQPKYGQT